MILSKMDLPVDETELKRWQMPDLNNPGGNRLGIMSSSMLEELKRLEKEAYDKGFQTGMSDGHETGRAETGKHAQYFIKLIDSMTRPFEQMDQRVAEELAGLAVVIAEQLVRCELTTKPELILDIAKNVIAALPVNTQSVQLHLNPEDAAIVRDQSQGNQAQEWQIMENASLERGDCRIFSADSSIDATLANQLQSIVTSAIWDHIGNIDA